MMKRLYFADRRHTSRRYTRLDDMDAQGDLEWAIGVYRNDNLSPEIEFLNSPP